MAGIVSGDKASTEKLLRSACAELEQRLRRGEACRAEEFFAAHPHLAADEEAALDLIYLEFLTRGELGEEAAPEEYYQRFPQWQRQLHKQFRVHEWVRENQSGREPSAVRTRSLRGTHQPRGPLPADWWPWNYEILDEIGRGGMGVVYKARQKDLKRLVAVKMILAGPHASPQDLARFRAEAEAVARLQHPNIVQIFEIGECRAGENATVPYLALEYVPGGSLAHHLAGQPQLPYPLAELLETLADAVHYAHQRGLIHRDLKPGNILLQKTDKETGKPADRTAGVENLVSLSPGHLVYLSPKITDFGLARSLSDTGSLAGARTESGMLVGTPSYMAPEQAAGEKSMGPAVDVHALGAILYEMLTGRPPFQGATALDTLEQLGTQDPVPPRRLQPKVPRDLETICLKCLHKDPARRYVSAQDLADDLRRFLQGLPIHARPVGPAERLVKWSRRRPAIAGLLATLILVVAGALAGLTSLWLRAESNREEAERQCVREERSSAQTRQVLEDFCNRLSEDTLREIPALQPMRKELLETGLKYYQQFLNERGDDPLLAADLARAQYTVAFITQQMGSREQAIAAFVQACPMLDKQRERDPSNIKTLIFLGRCYHSLGRLHSEMGETAEALPYFQQALAIQEPRAQGDSANNFHAELAWTSFSLGSSYEQQGQLTEALHWHKKAVKLWEQVAHAQEADFPLLINKQLSWNWLRVGTLHRHLGQRVEARNALERAEAILEKLVSAYPGVSGPKLLLASSRVELSQMQRGAVANETALQQELQQLAILEDQAKTNPWVSDFQLQLARCYRQVGIRYESTGKRIEAQDHFQNSLRILQQLVANQPKVGILQYELARLRLSIGNLHKAAGRTDEAFQSHQGTVMLMEKLVASYPKNSRYQRGLGSSYMSLGLVTLQLSKLDEALHAFQSAHRIIKHILRDQPDSLEGLSDLGSVLHNFALVEERAGRRQGALTLYQEAIEQQRLAVDKAPDVRHYRKCLSNHYAGLALINRTLGRPAEAATATREVARLWPNDPEAQFFTATEVALCIPLVGTGQAELTPEQSAERTRYADQAMDLLRQAVAAGFTDVQRLRKSVLMSVLNARPDFQKLVTELEQKAKPAAKQ